MDDVERRRQQALRLLDALSDDELRAVLAAQRTATWRLPKLVAHHRDHGDEWPEILNLPALSLEEYAALGPDLAAAWDRVFLAVEQGGPTWVFVRQVDGTSYGIVVAIRRGRIRTTLVTSDIAQWLGRQFGKHGAVEVTARARPA